MRPLRTRLQEARLGPLVSDFPPYTTVIGELRPQATALLTSCG